MVFSSSNCPSGGLQETVSEEEVISRTVNAVGGVSGSDSREILEYIYI